MVLLHIISGNRKQASDIADFLVKENLVLNAVTLQEVSVKEKGIDGGVDTSGQVLVIARTKGILFNTIETQLREAFPVNGPSIYSIPIVNMDWKEADSLVGLEAEYE